MPEIEKLLAEQVGTVRASGLFNRYLWAVGRLTIRGETPDGIVTWILAQEASNDDSTGRSGS